jgi:hypothetical protein
MTGRFERREKLFIQCRKREQMEKNIHLNFIVERKKPFLVIVRMKNKGIKVKCAMMKCAF